MDSWLRQSCSLLALQKESAQVFPFPQMWPVVSITSILCFMLSTSLCVHADLLHNEFIFFDPRVLVFRQHSVIYENHFLRYVSLSFFSLLSPHPSASNIASRRQCWRTSQRGLLCCKCMPWMQMREQMEKSNTA